MNYKVTSAITNTIAPTIPLTASTSPHSVCAADAPAPLLACVNDGGGGGGGNKYGDVDNDAACVDDDEGGGGNDNNYGDVDNDDACVYDNDDNYVDEGDTDEC